jgi:hypothetical protein
MPASWTNGDRSEEMKRFAYAAILAASLVLACSAVAAGGLTGTYKTKITGSKHFNGTWTLQFTKKGAYTVKHNGKVEVTGTFTSTDSKLTFLKGDKGPGACPGVGKYEWDLTGKKLKFTRISDSCSGRRTVLSHTLTKAG